jgi:L-iditol 2-dehydrogenase
METMKALVFHAPGNMALQSCPVPQIAADEALVKVRFAGVCGTDIRIYKGTKKIDAPRITGHEFAGDIAALGSGVKGFSVGDRVTAYPMIACGSCYVCRSGRTNICANRITLGYELDGGFATFIKIPAIAIAKGNLIKLPDDVSYEEGAASEPLTAAYNGIRRSNLALGQSVLIVGAGPIGLFHTQLAKVEGAGLIVVSEPQAGKRALAKELGADAVIDPSSENVQKRVKELTDGAGMDIVLADVGIPKVVEGAIEYIRKGGTYVIFAGCPTGSQINIDPNVIHYKELVVTGSSAAKPEDQRRMLKMIAEHRIQMKPLISDVLPAEKWQQAFAMKGNYQGLKTILAF